MTALALFHRVKKFDAWRKTAGFTAHTPSRTALCLSAWKQIKTAAAQDPQGLAAGLARYALSIWADAPETKTALDRSAREDYATCFAAAGAVDQAIDALVKQGSILPKEAAELSEINAVSALDILEKLSGVGQNLTDFIKKHPTAVGAAAGSGIGAGMGAWKDDDNRFRGALSGGIGGAAIGGLLGHGLSQHLDDQNLRFAKRLDLHRENATQQAADHAKIFRTMRDDEAARDAVAKTVHRKPDPEIIDQAVQDALAKVPKTPSSDSVKQETFNSPYLRSASGGVVHGGGNHPPSESPLSEPETYKAHFPVPPKTKTSALGPFTFGKSKKSSLGSLAWSKMSALEDPMQGNTPPAGAAPPNGAPMGGGPPPDPTGAAPAAQGTPTPNTPQGPSQPGLPTPENTTPGDPGAPEPLGQSPEEAMAQQAQQQEEQMAKEYQQHNTMVDNLSFLAQQVGLPSLAQEIEGTRNDLVQHFAAGNQHLPHNLQKYFPQSEHAKQFIEKYKARFAPITGGAGGKGGGGGAKKAASDKNAVSNDWLSKKLQSPAIPALHQVNIQSHLATPGIPKHDLLAVVRAALSKRRATPGSVMK